MSLVGTAPDDREVRFAFGRNWKDFLGLLTDERIHEAEKYLSSMLQLQRFDGIRFLDIGCGSGLSSLAARRLGADVCSFDFDDDSVACTRALRHRYYPEDKRWTVAQGSILDRHLVSSLGTFDVVYAWGVLHHTGQMWEAMELASLPVAVGGILFISIYNDQGWRSRIWRSIKKTYNLLPYALRRPFALMVIMPHEALAAAYVTLLRGGPAAYVRTWTQYCKNRGMSRWHDLLDWVGGYPFEVARPQQVIDYYRRCGFVVVTVKTCGTSLGCNQFVLRRSQSE